MFLVLEKIHANIFKTYFYGFLVLLVAIVSSVLLFQGNSFDFSTFLIIMLIAFFLFSMILSVSRQYIKIDSKHFEVFKNKHSHHILSFDEMKHAYLNEIEEFRDIGLERTYEKVNYLTIILHNKVQYRFDLSVYSAKDRKTIARYFLDKGFDINDIHYTEEIVASVN